MEPEIKSRNEQESLAALREYVSKAVDEIVRLRAQNKALARRLSQLESKQGAAAIDLAGADDPEELRATISGFIDAIDRYITETADDEQGGRNDRQKD